MFNRLRLSLFPRIRPDLRASHTRFARTATFGVLAVAALWAIWWLVVSLFNRSPGEITWTVPGIAGLILAGLMARALIARGKLVPAGYILAAALFASVALGSLLLPAYALFFGPAYMLSVLTAGAIIGSGAPYLFAAVSVMSYVASISISGEVQTASQAVNEPAVLALTALVYAGVAFTVAAVSNVLSRQVDRTIGNLQDQAEQLAKLARTDPLTGLANRRLLFERLESEFARAQRYQRPFCLLYIDLDGFKAINDRFGHLFGDEILRGSALAMQATLRSTDLIARIGGDEFAVLLPETTTAGAEYVVDKLRRSLAAYGNQLSPAVPPLTLSIGVGEISDGDEAIEDILARADKAQYLAKASGRALTRTQEDLRSATELD